MVVVFPVAAAVTTIEGAEPFGGGMTGLVADCPPPQETKNAALTTNTSKRKEKENCFDFRIQQRVSRPLRSTIPRAPLQARSDIAAAALN